MIARRLKAWRNSYLTANRRLFVLVHGKGRIDRLTDGKPITIRRKRNLETRVRRLITPWFWPRIEDADAWVESTTTSNWDPRNYLRSEPRPLLQRLIDTTQISDCVLDLGCNSGSDLHILHELGYRNLHGVDAGRDALRIFRETYPETWAAADVRNALFQDYLLAMPDDSFDVVHTHGATLELVHPSFPIISELCRVTRKSIYAAIFELGHAYPRKYIQEFERSGFQVSYMSRPDDLCLEPTYFHFTRQR